MRRGFKRFGGPGILYILTLIGEKQLNSPQYAWVWDWLPGVAVLWAVLAGASYSDRVWRVLFGWIPRVRVEWPARKSQGNIGDSTIKHIAAGSLEERRNINTLTAALEQIDSERGNLAQSLQQMTQARDAAIDAYNRCRHNFTMERFRRFGEDHPSATVKIRCAGYNDWPLVEQIKTLFEKEARWKVEVDPNNSPPLMPNAHFKVVVETADLGTLHRVHSLLDAEDGGLLPVRVGVYHNPENHNRNHLIVEVLPIVKE
jgi:hypothetical protein